MIEILKLDKSKMRFGAFDKTYNEYYDIPTDIINNKTPSLTFENIINEIKPIKNQDLLQKIYELYKPKKISRNKSKKSSRKSSRKKSKKSSRKKSKKSSRKGSRKGSRKKSKKSSRKGSRKI